MLRQLGWHYGKGDLSGRPAAIEAALREPVPARAGGRRLTDEAGHAWMAGRRSFQGAACSSWAATRISRSSRARTRPPVCH
jgi:hypothetical protein